MSQHASGHDPAEIDIAPFGRALGQLVSGLAALDARSSDTLIRDGVIQRFEFTYELAVRTLRRYLLSTALSPTAVQDLDFQDLIRRADEEGLLRTGWPEWKAFRKARTDTTHTYNEERAVEVLAEVREFAMEAQVLFDNLSRRLSSRG
jgi:nucleotidyltransferase substrate binding protein (TIGR01987 family)